MKEECDDVILAFLDLEKDCDENGSNISLQIPISLNVFFYAYVLNEFDKKGCLNKLC